MNIYNCLVSLNYLNSSLEVKSILNNNLSDGRVDKIISNLSKVLNQLAIDARGGRIDYNIYMKQDIVEELKKIDRALVSISDNSHSNQIKELSEKIDKVVSLVASSPVLENKTIQPIKVVSLAIFNDFDARDNNGFVAAGVTIALNQEVPFITTLSMFQAERDSSMDDTIPKLIKELQDKINSNQIYEKNGMLIFIPHSFLPEKSEKEKLQAFDLKPEDLKKISQEEIFTLFKPKPNMNSLADLFSNEPKANKSIYLVGHGNHETVGALNQENYGKFLNFLENQNCKGLSICSCCSGGVSSLLNIPDKSTGGLANFLDVENHHSFPTLVRSVGDFYVLGRQDAENDIKGFMTEMARIAENSELQTFQQIGQAINKYEKGQSKEYTNLMKLYPAHSSSVPGGFRLINERGREDFSLTLVKLRQAEVSSKDAKINISSTVERVEVHPLVSNVSLEIESKKSPVLLSLIPGTGHHFIKKITVASEDPIEFMVLTAKAQCNKLFDPNITKCFFIGEMSTPSRSLSKVVINISSTKSQFIFCEEGKYYLSSYGPMSGTKKVVEISESKFALLCNAFVTGSQPSEKAIRETSVGQEDENLFLEALNKVQFIPVDLQALFTPNISGFQLANNIIDYFEKRLFDPKDFELVKFCFNLKETPEVNEIRLKLKEFLITPKNAEAFPYSLAFLKQGGVGIKQQLEKENVPVILSEFDEFILWDEIIKKGDADSAGILYAASDHTFQNKFLLPSLLKDENATIFEAILKNGLNRRTKIKEINESHSRHPKSLLEYALKIPYQEKILNILFDNRFSIEQTVMGFHTPLSYAVEIGDLKLAELLLKRGANPSATIYPLEDAETVMGYAERSGSAEMVALLQSKEIQRKDANSQRNAKKL